MQAKKNGVARGLVYAHIVEQYEQCAKQCLVEEKDCATNDCTTCPITLRSLSPRPNNQGEYQDQRQSGGNAVCEFDQRLRLGHARQELSIA